MSAGPAFDPSILADEHRLRLSPAKQHAIRDLWNTVIVDASPEQLRERDIHVALSADEPGRVCIDLPGDDGERLLASFCGIGGWEPVPLELEEIIERDGPLPWQPIPTDERLVGSTGFYRFRNPGAVIDALVGDVAPGMVDPEPTDAAARMNANGIIRSGGRRIAMPPATHAAVVAYLDELVDLLERARALVPESRVIAWHADRATKLRDLIAEGAAA